MLGLLSNSGPCEYKVFALPLSFIPSLKMSRRWRGAWESWIRKHPNMIPKHPMDSLHLVLPEHQAWPSMLPCPDGEWRCKFKGWQIHLFTRVFWGVESQRGVQSHVDNMHGSVQTCPQLSCSRLPERSTVLILFYLSGIGMPIPNGFCAKTKESSFFTRDDFISGY